ncbi:hypothetical protein M5K25_006526 [Dendrobium thyrsiflorum]|uniref:Uncharacterized protein n=1 Tax=Dendrobium thyrsiflorum TaxID=117978 RepID=A0ABD0VCX2_DENTH
MVVEAELQRSSKFSNAIFDKFSLPISNVIECIFRKALKRLFPGIILSQIGIYHKGIERLLEESSMELQKLTFMSQNQNMYAMATAGALPSPAVQLVPIGKKEMISSSCGNLVAGTVIILIVVVVQRSLSEFQALFVSASVVFKRSLSEFQALFVSASVVFKVRVVISIHGGVYPKGLLKHKSMAGGASTIYQVGKVLCESEEAKQTSKEGPNPVRPLVHRQRSTNFSESCYLSGGYYPTSHVSSSGVLECACDLPPLTPPPECE